MKLWKIYRTDRVGYDEYDSAIVAAETEWAARCIHPSEYIKLGWPNTDWTIENGWVDDPALVNAEHIGESETIKKAGVILASFNAG
jgi:hypothetical protein